VGPLADALGALRERRSAPLLARHLNDPANSIDDVSHAAVALETLATGAELGELKTFFALYRATADEPLLVRAVLSVGAALLRVGGPDGKSLVERASSDPLTQPEVRQGLGELVAPKPKPEGAGGDANTETPAKTETPAAPPTTSTKP
jgi:outer membrane protein assembly factor BamB